MPPESTRAALRAGLIAGLPFCVIVIPFAALFGVAATSAGLDLVQTMAFTVLVIAGAAQLTAIQLITDQAPVIVILLSALAVNLRMAMYSAALAPHLGAEPFWTRVLIGYLNVDQSYAISALEFERHPAMTGREKAAFFLGTMIPIAPAWYAATLLGAVLGGRFLPAVGTDFLVPLIFFAIIAPGLRTAAHLAAAVVAAALGLALHGLPYSLGLLPAAAAGMIAGAEVERRTARAAPP